MVDSVLFEFTKIDDFYEVLINSEGITTDLFDGVTPNFRVVIAEACPDNIEDCLDEDYSLNSSVSLINTDSNEGKCALAWIKGVNSNRTISLPNGSLFYDFADETYLWKAAFLVVDTGSAAGTVLAYSINNAPISIQKQLILPTDGMVWSIVSKTYEG